MSKYLKINVCVCVWRSTKQTSEFTAAKFGAGVPLEADDHVVQQEL